MLEFADPRAFPAAAGGHAAAVVADAEASLAAAQSAVRDAHDRRIDAALAAALADDSAMHMPADAVRYAPDSDVSPTRAAASSCALAAILAAAPPGAVYRHLWRRLGVVAAAPWPIADHLALRLFAVPLVIVVAGERDGDTCASVLRDPAAAEDLLRRHAALGADVHFALAGALVPAHAIDVAALPRLRRDAIAAASASTPQPLALAAPPMAIDRQESVHLRFLVGTAFCAPASPPLTIPSIGDWATPLAQVLSRALAVPGASILVLPRTPAPLPQALAEGRIAQREVSAQVFVSNALRRMRASIGEPTAIVSAHRLDDGGGELRVSLSSPFSPRDAEGFRCALLPFERVGDAAAMLEDLLRDCRVGDVRVEPGVHADRDRATGLTLLFKPAQQEARRPD
ncbi:MAG TPA: hypothetical protein VGR63_01325 [Casimicrobiaceae bacterium]|nr:hypothetical protein [Casimicrobiaceae bacterium]